MAWHQAFVAVLLTLWITQIRANYYDYQPVYYNFDWQVKDEYSGNDYGQTESRNGELTTGLYQVLLPDGRHQTVKYTVDKGSGFVADVSYVGQANYFNFHSNYNKQQTTSKPTKSYDYTHIPVEVYQHPKAYRPSNYQRPAPAVRPKLPTTTTPAPIMTYQEQQEEIEVENTENNREILKQHSAVSPPTAMLPLYRVDYYAARAKAGKSIPAAGQGTYAIDANSGTTYIRPAAFYSAPEKLGTYEIKHRKATVRKPSKSDYQAPQSLILQE